MGSRAARARRADAADRRPGSVIKRAPARACHHRHCHRAGHARTGHAGRAGQWLRTVRGDAAKLRQQLCASRPQGHAPAHQRTRRAIPAGQRRRGRPDRESDGPAMIRLLIVDDHEMVREGLKAILVSEPDFSIVGEAASAEQALELTERLQPDIALVDIRLPGTNGIELCRIINERYPQTAVIILTTFTDESLVAQCIQAGARGFIVKDIERLDLKRSIRAVARGEAAIDTKVAASVLAQLRRNPLSSEASPSPDRLSSQQLVILRLIAQGLSSREIATQLYLSENTVKGYVQEILHRLGVKNRTEAVMVAVKQGWL